MVCPYCPTLGMDYLMLLRDWGFTFTQTLMVRFPLERKWDSILEYFGHDEKLTVVTGKSCN